jgi:hypothetical protein
VANCLAVISEGKWVFTVPETCSSKTGSPWPRLSAVASRFAIVRFSNAAETALTVVAE